MDEQVTRSDPSPGASPHWTVACLCAAWCRLCGEYRPVFDELETGFTGRVRFLWVDIEDDEEALGEVDVVDFPTLLIARGDTVVFFGPVLPHPGTARQLIDHALAGNLPSSGDTQASGLPARLRRSGSGADKA